MKRGHIRHRADEHGFTLIELLVVIFLVSVLVTISALAFRTYAQVQAHRGTPREIVAIMRNVQVRAATEGRSYRCVFDATGAIDSMTCSRGVTGGPQVKSYTLASYLQLTDVSFAHPPASGISDNTVIFTARGTADDGSLKVIRTNSSKVYSVAVESLTARISYDD